MLRKQCVKVTAPDALRNLSTSCALRAAQESKKKRTSKKDASEVNYGALSKAQKAFLDRLIRVDQAGELGANYIYNGQHTVLASRYPHLRPVLQHMWDQEVHHHNTFNRLQTQRRVRPSLLTPLWKLGAFGMGAGTSLLSKEAAMACTVAVETVIGNHYNQQLRVLMNQYNVPVYDKKTGEPLDASQIKSSAECSPEISQLKELVSQFRDEELEHLDTAIEHDAEKAVPYILLTEAIKLVCKGAIWTAERV
ncbi:Piso0_005658 [Millerozyma farinosa CBS 7064]|uniref:5-demethoxyubiquinone hydroxylase, mitochondrial n=1 Tax=Pichia sorbitophila (strain ATCC MYA-4447 / BCRC 22081 / CBS 7064 / NBRC 10061 / NRRL Y-12695) TaxID=559304 RepID=G8XZL0_PICSO|nr:Piso0_005658 [Millerozyma farinosa CBS 7064]